MKVIVCLDLSSGMLFNNRRQSRDRVVIEDIIQTTSGKKLWMNSYTHSLFAEKNAEIMVDEMFLYKASTDDFCFVENLPLEDFTEEIEEIIVYRWDKKYPQTTSFDISLSPDQWTLSGVLEITGYSHEKIMKEVYKKK